MKHILPTVTKIHTFQDRSIVISTYALCGFSNLGSMGIQLGALGAMAPSRKSDLAAIAFRAMMAGNVACFMTACIAGMYLTSQQSIYVLCYECLYTDSVS